MWTRTQEKEDDDMKAQKLGLVLGMNMAVACLVLQGCKATRSGADNLPPPVVDPAVAQPQPTAPVAVAPVEQQPITVTPVTTPPPPPPVVEPTPSKVTEVKPLPPPATPKKHPKAVAPVAGGSTVVVQRGDTLSGICVRHRVKMSAVVAANPGLKPNHIRVGQKIVLPGVAAGGRDAVQCVRTSEKPDSKVKLAAADAPVTAANTTAPVKTKSAFKAYTGPTKTYKVRSGDSLGKIAHENGITIRALKDLNKLTKDSIRVGQELLIPAEKVVEKKADAAAGKTAAKTPDAKKAVAKKDAKEPKKEGAEKKEAAAPVAETTSLSNAVEAVTAAPAEVVPAPAAAESATPDSAPAPSSATYTAKEGDDIVSIAIAYGISPSRLMDLNDLKAGDSIKAGQVLKLPADAKPSAQ